MVGLYHGSSTAIIEKQKFSEILLLLHLLVTQTTLNLERLIGVTIVS